MKETETRNKKKLDAACAPWDSLLPPRSVTRLSRLTGPAQTHSGRILIMQEGGQTDGGLTCLFLSTKRSGLYCTTSSALLQACIV